MKQRAAKLSGVLIVFALCTGCCSVQPAHPLAATAVASVPADKGKGKDKDSAAQDYPMKWFVDGWLLGRSAPPDFPEPGDDGSQAWLLIGWPFQILGQCLAR